MKTIKATAGAHKGRSCSACSPSPPSSPASRRFEVLALRYGADSRPASTNAPSVDPAATSDARRRAGVALCLVSACGFGLMAIFAKEAYAAGLGVISAARRALRRSPRPSSGRSSSRARRRSAAPPPRRVEPCSPASRSAAIGYAAQAGALLRRAGAHRRLADVAAALHVPRARRSSARVALRPRARRRRAGACGARRSPPPAPRSCCSAAALGGARRRSAWRWRLGAARRLRGLHPRRRRRRRRASTPFALAALVMHRRRGDVRRRRRCDRRPAPRRSTPSGWALDRRDRARLHRRRRSSTLPARPGARRRRVTASIVSTVEPVVTVVAGGGAVRRARSGPRRRSAARSCWPRSSLLQLRGGG